jgi:hypothetical protein
MNPSSFKWYHVDSPCQQAIILPVYNARSWLPDCFRSIACQIKNKLKVELSVFDDGSTDDSLDVIEKWQPVLEAEGFKVFIGGHKEPAPKGGTGSNFVLSNFQIELLFFLKLL